MIRKVAIKRSLYDRSAERQDIEYWLSRPPGERMEAMEALRRQFFGELPRIEKVARVIRRSTG